MSIRRSILKRGLATILTLGLGFMPVSSAFADTTIGGTKWVDSLTFGGDLRLRHDWMVNTGGRPDRNRERFRFRFGAEAVIQDWMAAFRLGTSSYNSNNGTTSGSQVSGNQTMGGGFGQKPLWVDLAYVQYKAQENIKLIGGRMPNPFWQLYASDSMWDPDLNPEGYAQKYEWPTSDRLRLFANLAQLPVNEIGSNEEDPWVFGEQLGIKSTWFDETKVNLAIADYGFIHETTNTFGVPDPKYGNSIKVVGGNQVLSSPFNILQLTGELAFHAMSIPLSIQGDFVSNNQETTGKGRNGYQTGFIAGKASAAQTWELAYFYKYLGANATVSSFADDDFGNGGTNRAGHIFWVGYSPRDYVQFKVKYYITRVLDQTLSNTAWNPGFNSTYDKDLNRLFVDCSVKF